MSTTRGPLVIRFEKLFSEFADKKSLCISSSQLKLKNDNLTRVFDSFPPLLDHALFSVISHQFQTIVTSAKVSVDSESNPSIDAISKANIDIWFRNIIKFAREDLVNVDVSGINIQASLVALFEWQEYQEKLQGITALSNLILAYYAAVYSVLSLHLRVQMNNHELAFKAVSQYIHEIDKLNVIMSEFSITDDIEEVHSAPRPLIVSENSSLVTISALKSSGKFLFPFFQNPRDIQKNHENEVEMEVMHTRRGSTLPNPILCLTAEETSDNEKKEAITTSNVSGSTFAN